MEVWRTIGDGFSVGLAGAASQIFLCPSANFASMRKNHFLVISSEQIRPRFYFINLLIFFILKLKTSF